MPDIAQHPIQYWLWLSLAVPQGNAAGDKLLAHFANDPKRIYEAEKEEYELADISPAVISPLSIFVPT